VTGRDLGQDHPDAAGVLELHLDQTPGLRCWLTHDRDSDRGQPGVLGVNIADLDPDHHRAPGRRVEENARSAAELRVLAVGGCMPRAG
jgi:hypothetical protein